MDDKVLKPILADLYFPQSPYEFSVLPVEILGNVYEQFLGKVIRLTAAHQAKVEEKPEVQKAGGVYYTPPTSWITSSRTRWASMVEGKSPKQLAAFPRAGYGLRLRLVPAGRVSIPAGLLPEVVHRTRSRKTISRSGLASRGEEWRLTTAKRSASSPTHIFGVDIDRQAVEVTKLSLLLKVLEGESDETLRQGSCRSSRNGPCPTWITISSAATA